MDNAIVLFLLRAIHVVGGVLWVGGVVLVTIFLPHGIVGLLKRRKEAA